MRVIFIWIILSTGLFLCPGPSFWYSLFQGLGDYEGKVVSFLAEKVQVSLITIEEHKKVKQFIVHFILMTVCAFFFSKEVSLRINVKRGVSWTIIAVTTLFVFVFSFLIECIQSVLPISFARGFDWFDIFVSILGGLMAIIIMSFENRDK